jgi:hypothetical protein
MVPAYSVYTTKVCVDVFRCYYFVKVNFVSALEKTPNEWNLARA